LGTPSLAVRSDHLAQLRLTLRLISTKRWKERKESLARPKETIIGMLDQERSFPISECLPALLEQGDAVQITLCLVQRPIFMVTTGHLGTGDDTAQPGDMIYVLLGGETPCG
jgi:hypothetical protein